MENQEITAKKPINPMMILAAILVIAAIATYIVPAGSFDRIPNEATGYDVIDVNSFHYIESNPVGVFDVFKSFTLGLQQAAYVIFFLMIIGGTFQIVEATGALKAGLSNLVIKMKGSC